MQTTPPLPSLKQLLDMKQDYTSKYIDIRYSTSQNEVPDQCSNGSIKVTIYSYPEDDYQSKYKIKDVKSSYHILELGGLRAVRAVIEARENNQRTFTSYRLTDAHGNGGSYSIQK